MEQDISLVESACATHPRRRTTTQNADGEGDIHNPPQHPDVDGRWAWVIFGCCFCTFIVLGGQKEHLFLYICETIHKCKITNILYYIWYLKQTLRIHSRIFLQFATHTHCSKFTCNTLILLCILK